jgi:hypothetical protein
MTEEKFISRLRKVFEGWRPTPSDVVWQKIQQRIGIGDTQEGYTHTHPKLLNR